MRTPNHPDIDCRGGLPHSSRSDPYWQELTLNVAARSRHIGGVHALFCDGSVKFVSTNVAFIVWRALGSRNAQEEISNSMF